MPASTGTTPRKIAAVLFDMDGTLVDSDAAVDRAWITWSAQYGVDPAVPLAIAPGHPADATIGRILPELDPPAIAEAAAHQLALQYDDLTDVVPVAGAHDLLAFLDARAIPWAVVTSADQRLAKLRLAAAGISPRILITTDDVEVGKPDPAGYLRAAELLGVAPTDCLVVEDAEPGVAAGRAAGAVVAALKGVPGDIQIDGLHRVAELIAGAEPTAEPTETPIAGATPGAAVGPTAGRDA